MTSPPTISIAIPTHRRPAGLRRALEAARERLEAPNPPFHVAEVIVIDNDPDGSASEITNSISWDLLRYVHEPRPGVANARNRALDEAVGDVLVMFDDDERPGDGWPWALITTALEHDAAVVAGPVRPVFSDEPPTWVRELGVFERPEPRDGASLDWARTGNLALDMSQTKAAGLRFDTDFNAGGEDVRFSTLAGRAGLDMRWSAEPVVYEDVGADRLTETWTMDRARHAMFNYVRARSPLPRPQLLRTALVALARVAVGTGQAQFGRWSRREAIRIRGGLRRARGAGAIRALLPGRGHDPLRSESSVDSTGSDTLSERSNDGSW